MDDERSRPDFVSAPTTQATGTRVSRRTFVKGATATTGAAIASSYVKPNVRGLGIPGAAAQVSDPPSPPPPPPPPPPPTGTGTGTIGFWLAAPVSNWPVSSLTIGGVTYSPSQLQTFFPPSGPDQGKKLMVQLIAAMLNVADGNESSCIAATIAAANTFFANHPPGSTITSAQAAQAVALAGTLDAYNNGDMCAPHRDD